MRFSNLHICICLIFSMSFAIVFSFGLDAYAQPRKAKTRAARQTKAKAANKIKAGQKSTSTTKSSGKVVEFGTLTLKGEVQRPSAQFILSRGKLKFRPWTPKKSFLPKIYKSVESPPF